MTHCAIQKVNGRAIEVPVEPDGSIEVDVLCELANIPPNRTLLLQCPDGTNQIVNRGQKIKVRPRSFFVDAPAHTRGS
jgi:hypothetical protein